MSPEEIAADASQRARFLTEVAYLDRKQPSEREVEDDLDVLASPDGLTVIAWLWPSPAYLPDFDPFNAASRANAAPGRFMKIIEATAYAVGRSEEDIKSHLRWSIPLTELELDRVLEGRAPLPLTVIPGICCALQLEFADVEWVMVDPQRLARRVDQSVLASGIADRLRHLTTDSLEAVLKRLPRGSVAADRAWEPEVYLAPGPPGRYWSLYEALAADGRDSPDYTLAEIDRILIEAGEKGLPASASTDRSWWAGTGAKTEGRPQVSAWWGAGYRIRRLETDPSSGQVTSVGFEPLPGRAEWLTNPERTALREYRVPSPTRVPIYPFDDRAWRNMRIAASTLAAVVEHAMQADSPDNDIRLLLGLLAELGEANRSQIVDHFNQIRDETVDEGWMTNLLTRARRHGLTVNSGTRSQPRWVIVSHPCPSCGQKSLQPLSTDFSRCSECGASVTKL